MSDSILDVVSCLFLIVFLTVGVKVPASDGASGESPWHSWWPAAPATGLTALFSCLLCEVNGSWLLGGLMNPSVSAAYLTSS